MGYPKDFISGQFLMYWTESFVAATSRKSLRWQQPRSLTANAALTAPALVAPVANDSLSAIIVTM